MYCILHISNYHTMLLSPAIQYIIRTYHIILQISILSRKTLPTIRTFQRTKKLLVLYPTSSLFLLLSLPSLSSPVSLPLVFKLTLPFSSRLLSLSAPLSFLLFSPVLYFCSPLPFTFVIHSLTHSLSFLYSVPFSLFLLSLIPLSSSLLSSTDSFSHLLSFFSLFL